VECVTDAQRNARYRRTYGITLDEYNEQLVKQGGGCLICQSKPVTWHLAVDHDHTYKRVPITVQKLNNKLWVAVSHYRGFDVELTSTKKIRAIRAVRNALKRMANRGVVCFNCNRSIRSMRNSAEFCENMAEYLRKDPIWM